MTAPHIGYPQPGATVTTEKNGTFRINAVLSEQDATFLRALIGRSQAGMCHDLWEALHFSGAPRKRLAAPYRTIEPIYSED